MAGLFVRMSASSPNYRIRQYAPGSGYTVIIRSPNKLRACCHVATGRSYFSQRSIARWTSAALDGARRSRSSHTLSSSPVRVWPPLQIAHSLMVSCAGPMPLFPHCRHTCPTPIASLHPSCKSRPHDKPHNRLRRTRIHHHIWHHAIRRQRGCNCQSCYV